MCGKVDPTDEKENDMDSDDNGEAEFALGVWQHGTNDDVWDAVFNPFKSRFADTIPEHDEFLFIDVAGELLTRIESDPTFTVGDLTHDEVIASIIRRYPLLGPMPPRDA